jgi:hypothetical protein
VDSLAGGARLLDHASLQNESNLSEGQSEDHSSDDGDPEAHGYQGRHSPINGWGEARCLQIDEVAGLGTTKHGKNFIDRQLQGAEGR